MRQSNKHGSARNDVILNLQVRALASPFPTSCKKPATFIDSIQPNNQPEKGKDSKSEIQLPTNYIVMSTISDLMLTISAFKISPLALNNVASS